jgi:hypothetical protein
MCGYLEWNLNVQGEEVIEFESRVRAEHGPKAIAKASSSSSSDIPIVVPAVNAYPTPETTPDPSRPIRPVPSPYKNRPQPQQQSQISFPSPPISPQHYLHPSHSPQPPHFASASSSLASSPASDDCKTPSPIAMTAAPHRSSKGDVSRAFDARARQHASNLHSYAVNVGAW